MSNYFGITSDSVSTLFASLRTNKNTTNTNFLGNTKFVSEYASLKNGSYYKLSKAYYNKQDGSDNKFLTTNGKDTQIGLKSTKDTADDLKAVTQELLKKGTDSVFTKEKMTLEDGTESYEINSKKVLKKIENFIKDYNQVIDSTQENKATGILTPAASLTGLATGSKQLFQDIGITISSNNKLEIDKEIFEKADMTKVKALFQGAGSYGYQVQSKAFSIAIAAQSELDKEATYSKKGTYNYLSKPHFDTRL